MVTVVWWHSIMQRTIFATTNIQFYKLRQIGSNIRLVQFVAVMGIGYLPTHTPVTLFINMDK